MLLQIHEPGQTPTPHATEETLAVGIDLGTTHCVVAIARDEKPETLRDENGASLIPSIMEYDGQIIRSIKRLMSGVAPERFSHATDQTQGGMVRVHVGNQKLTPVEISADILRLVKTRAEKSLGREVNKAVITVPAYFDDAARSATRAAATLAGIDVLRLINEPTAAALAYGLDQQAEGLYAIYDLGGGTFDFSLLEMQKGVFQVLGTGGNTLLGGDDFDQLIADHLNVDMMQARTIKEKLSTSENMDGITRTDFENMIAPLVQKTIDVCQQVLISADKTIDQIKGVVLVGGSTRVPLVQKSVAAFFNQQPLTNINPDEVVAQGAALQAEALTVGSNNLLLDVTPLSLGLETMGGLVEKIIERNTPIPAAKSQEFTTGKDGQTAMLIHVVQGERETVDQNRSLARFEIRGIPALTAGLARIEINFTLDADGVLTVSAREKTTNTTQQIEVKPSYGLTETEMANMLRDSLENAQQDMTKRLLIQSRLDADRVINATQAALEKDGDLLNVQERDQIITAQKSVQAALEKNDRENIQNAVEELEKQTAEFAERRVNKALKQTLQGKSVDQVAATT